ncbi:hypothetical protein FRC01_004094, partial [Tulasnella sp. 417]
PPNLINILLVSAYWYQVAVTSPYLWTYITVTSEMKRKYREHAIHIIKRDLLRSKECPLNVVIKVRRWNFDDSVESLLEVAGKHSHRWRTLLVRALAPRAVKILEQLHLPQLFSVSYAGHLPGVNVKLDAPHLKSFHAFKRGECFTFAEPEPVLTLLSYSLFRNGTQGLLEHLRRSQYTLTTLRIRASGPQSNPISDTSTQLFSVSPGLSFPALTEYFVTFDSDRWDWNVFHMGQMAQLRKLTIRWRSFRNPPLTAEVFIMPQLRILAICADDPDGFENAILPLLATAPNLEELRLAQATPSPWTNREGWIPPLLSEEQEPAELVCPRLAVLRLCKITIPRWDDLKRLASRRPGFTKLSLDSICWGDSKGEEQDLTLLKQCFDIVVEDGLEF